MIVTASLCGDYSYEGISRKILLRGTQLTVGSVRINSLSVGNWPNGLEVRQVDDCKKDRRGLVLNSRTCPLKAEKGDTIGDNGSAHVIEMVRWPGNEC